MLGAHCADQGQGAAALQEPRCGTDVGTARLHDIVGYVYQNGEVNGSICL